jgi:hypothetical protein
VTAPTIAKVVRLELDERENFILNSIYAIGLAYTACDESQAALIARELVKILRGPKGRIAAFALAEKMKVAAKTATKEDLDRMAIDP